MPNPGPSSWRQPLRFLRHANTPTDHQNYSVATQTVQFTLFTKNPLYICPFFSSKTVRLSADYSHLSTRYAGSLVTDSAPQLVMYLDLTVRGIHANPHASPEFQGKELFLFLRKKNGKCKVFFSWRKYYFFRFKQRNIFDPKGKEGLVPPRRSLFAQELKSVMEKKKSVTLRSCGWIIRVESQSRSGRADEIYTRVAVSHALVVRMNCKSWKSVTLRSCGRMYVCRMCSPGLAHT